MKILFIGGYGNISWWCAKQAIANGFEVFLLNRNLNSGTRREIPKDCKIIVADYTDFTQTNEALIDYNFDVVCDFLCKNEEDAKRAYKLFKDKTKQYIFISTESVYKRDKNIQKYVETSPQYDDKVASPYIAGKIRCEKYFLEKYKKSKFPITIVRPGYTLDTILPYSIGQNCYTVAKRYLEGKPFLIAGSGENSWAFTHSSDFAYPFCKLLGNSVSIGEAYNIMSDNYLSFNHIMSILAQNLSPKKAPKLIHIPYEDCLTLSYFMAKDLMEQRLMDAHFDTSKIKKLVPDWQIKIDMETGIKRSLEWLNADSKRMRFNKALDEKLEELTNKYRNSK